MNAASAVMLTMFEYSAFYPMSDIGAFYNQTGYTALMEAAKWNQLCMIEILLAAGAGSHTQDQVCCFLRYQVPIS